MIRLFYADRAHHLVDALAEGIREAHQAGQSPLEPTTLIVPDQATAAYLKMAVAEHMGIAANLRIEFLRQYLDTLARTHREVALIDAARLELVLIDVLQDEARLEDRELAPVRRYIEAGADASARDLRRTQLARTLARLYDEYLLTRPEMIASWQRPGPLSGDSVERWEGALWRALAEPLATAGLEPMSQAFEAFVPPPGTLPAALHVWGLSVGGSVLQTVLARLAQATRLHLYTLNPCLEFWEDVRTGPDHAFLRERLGSRAALAPDPEQADDPFHLGAATEDTPALRLWGRPGRENIRLLNALTDCDFEARFSEPEALPDSLLGRIQRDVLLREPARSAPEGPLPDGDGSLQVRACASLRREVEAIAADIWALVRDAPEGRPPLRFDEIAIALVGPDQDTYRAHIGAVFKEHHEIPHSALDVPLSGSSRVVEAVELLLRLPGSGYGRQDLLRLVTHPVVAARYDESSDDEWLAWCEALAVVHGADHHDHEDTYILRDLYNWDQGLRRLVLGTFMSGVASGDERRFVASGQRYLPHEYPLDRVAVAAQLVVLVRSLIADARYASRARMPVHAWADFLRTLVGAYVTPANDQDERDLLRVLATLQALEGLHPTGGEVGFDVVAELVRARLEALTSNRGPALAEGVVVAPLALVAALPFRVVFVPGLGEGKFPAAERRNQLDLRGRQRQPGDISPRARDQYWFLERLMATQDSLHLSWISRNPQTGDRQEPSVVIQELRGFVERGYLGAGGWNAIEQHQALRRYAESEPVAPFESAAVQRERQALALRRDLLTHLGSDDGSPELEALRAHLPRQTWEAVSARLHLADPPAATAEAAGRIDVPYGALRRFLEDPLQGWAEHVLQLRQDDIEADPFATEDELFRTERRDEQRMLLDVFLEALQDPEAELEAIYGAHAELLELSGRMPTGVFANSERRRHLEVLGAWRTQLRRAFGGRAKPVQRLRFGRAREHARVREVAEAITIPLPDGRRVDLRGSTDPLSEDPAASFVAMSRGPSSGRARALPELRIFLDHAVLAASGRTFPKGYRGFVAYDRPAPDHLDKLRYEAFTPEEARAWLGTLLTDLLDEAHAYTLPFVTALGIFEAREKGAAALEEVLAQARPSPFGPLARARVRPPSVEDALQMVARRFEAFFRRRTEELR